MTQGEVRPGKRASSVKRAHLKRPSVAFYFWGTRLLSDLIELCCCSIQTAD